MVQEQGQPPPLLITISVDVGSTATKVSYFDHARGVVELVEINGAKSMPSAVFYSNDPAQRCRFGKHALSRPAKNCQCVLVEIKRMLACTSLGAVEGGTSTGNTSRWMPCHPPEEVAWQHHFRVAPTSEKDEEPRYLVAGSQESVAVHQVLSECSGAAGGGKVLAERLRGCSKGFSQCDPAPSYDIACTRCLAHCLHTSCRKLLNSSNSRAL